MHNFEYSASSPVDNRVSFDINTPIGIFTYDSDAYLSHLNVLEVLNKFGLTMDDLNKLQFKDIRNIVFDIDITARIRKED